MVHDMLHSSVVLQAIAIANDRRKTFYSALACNTTVKRQKPCAPYNACARPPPPSVLSETSQVTKKNK